MHTRIKEIRKALKMNQLDFAQRLGLSQPTLGMIEVGKRTFSEKHKKLICSEFNVNKSWLEFGKGDIFNASPLENELIDTFSKLSPETKDFLLITAKELLRTQNKMLPQETRE